MKRKRVWVTGAGGLIGNYLVQTALSFSPDWEAVPLTRALDLTEFKAVSGAFHDQRPDAVIHCAAMSRSPECQAKPELARKINVDVTRHLSELASDIPFFFFSTDLVFDGQKGNYDETDAVHPLSVYAETKVLAERAVLINPKHTVIRTSLNSGTSPTRDRGLDEQLRIAWQRGDTLNLFVDEFRSPIPAEVTARAVWELLNAQATGIFHIAGGERLSRWEIGQILVQRWPEFKAQMRPGTIKEWNGAPRPPDTSFNCAKVQKLLSFKLPSWREYMQRQ